MGKEGQMVALTRLLWLLAVVLFHLLPLLRSTDPLLSPKGVNYEVAALMSVKSKMRDGVGAMDGWDINSVDPCTWSMVGCSPDGVVISLEMASNGFAGTLSPSIGNLSHLQTMLLQNNEISGPIPPEIGKLSQLKTLDLSGNQFIGEIPSSLGSLTNLNYLRLNKNNLSGYIPGVVANLSRLSFLDLSFNNLSGPTPKILAKDYSFRLSKCWSLGYLYFSVCILLLLLATWSPLEVVGIKVDNLDADTSSYHCRLSRTKGRSRMHSKDDDFSAKISI